MTRRSRALAVARNPCAALAHADLVALAALVDMGGGTATGLADAMARASGGPADRAAAREAVERLACLGLVGPTQGGAVQAPTDAGLLAVEVALAMAEALSPAVAPQPPRLPVTTPAEVSEALRGIGLLGLVEVAVEDGGYLLRPTTRDVARSREQRLAIRGAFSGRKDVWVTGGPPIPGGTVPRA